MNFLCVQKKSLFVLLDPDLESRSVPVFKIQIRIQQLREYGSNTDPDPKPWIRCRTVINAVA